MIFDELQNLYKFKRAEKGMAGVMLFDMASNISQPLFKSLFDNDTRFDSERVIISAKRSLENTLSMIGESFGFDIVKAVEENLISYATLAILHFEKCLRRKDVHYGKRENEYLEILQKVQKKGDKI